MLIGRRSGEVTLDAYAGRVCEVLAAGQPAVLVGHSMGGMVVTQAAARMPEQVSALVYLCAFVPVDGESLLVLTPRPEAADDQIQANLTISGDPPVAELTHEAARLAIYGMLHRGAVPVGAATPAATAGRAVHQPVRARPRQSRGVRGAAAQLRHVPAGPLDPAGDAALHVRPSRALTR